MGVGAQANVRVINPILERTANGVELQGNRIIIDDYMNSTSTDTIYGHVLDRWFTVGIIQGLEDVANDEDWDRVEFSEERLAWQDSELKFSDGYGWISPSKLPPFEKAFEIHIGGKERHWIDDDYREVTLVPSDLLQDLYADVKNPPDEDEECFSTPSQCF